MSYMCLRMLCMTGCCDRIDVADAFLGNWKPALISLTIKGEV